MKSKILVNASWLGSYVYCPRKFFIEHILGIKPPVKPEALILGTVVHEVFDKTSKREREIVERIEKIDKNHIEKIYIDSFLKELKETILDQNGVVLRNNYSTIQAFERVWKIIINEARERAQEIFKIAKHNNVVGEKILEHLEPIIISEKRLESEKLLIKGKIDRLELYKDNLAVPIEFKTGESPYNGLHLAHKLQIASYLMLLREKGFNVKYGIVKYVKEGKVVPVILTKDLEEKVFEVRDKIIELIETLKMPDYCENKEVCLTKHLRDLPKSEKEVIEAITKNS